MWLLCIHKQIANSRSVCRPADLLTWGTCTYVWRNFPPLLSSSLLASGNACGVVILYVLGTWSWCHVGNWKRYVLFVGDCGVGEWFWGGMRGGELVMALVGLWEMRYFEGPRGRRREEWREKGELEKVPYLYTSTQSVEEMELMYVCVCICTYVSLSTTRILHSFLINIYRYIYIYIHIFSVPTQHNIPSPLPFSLLPFPLPSLFFPNEWTGIKIP